MNRRAERNQPELTEEGRFVRTVFVGIGVTPEGEIVTTDAFMEKLDAVEALRDNACFDRTMRIVEVSYDVDLTSVEVPTQKVEVKD